MIRTLGASRISHKLQFARESVVRFGRLGPDQGPPATPGTVRGDYALVSGTTSCMVPACLRQPAGSQDLLPGARSPLFAPAGEDTVPPRQQPVSHPGSSADGFVGRLVCHGQHAGV